MNLFRNKVSSFLFLPIIVLLVLIGFISLDIHFPSLPAIANFFQISTGTSQLSVTLYLVGFGVSQLLYGPLADIYGRKPILFAGFVIFFIGGILCMIGHF